jgi:hypothetical protein
VSSLNEAAAAVHAAKDVLDREPRDYALGFSLLRQAVDLLEEARGLDSKLVSDPLIRRLLAESHEAAIDVVAYVTMARKAPVLTRAITEMERGIGRARCLTRQGAFGAAARAYLAVATRGNPLIEWDDRGKPFSDPSEGFFAPRPSAQTPPASEP